MKGFVHSCHFPRKPRTKCLAGGCRVLCSCLLGTMSAAPIGQSRKIDHFPVAGCWEHAFPIPGLCAGPLLVSRVDNSVLREYSTGEAWLVMSTPGSGWFRPSPSWALSLKRFTSKSGVHQMASIVQETRFKLYNHLLLDSFPEDLSF